MRRYALTSADLIRRTGALAARYDFIECITIGHSTLGRPLRTLCVGSGENEIFVSGAHHGNEWITALLLLRFCEDYARACAAGERFYQADAAALLPRVKLYLLPLVNPDGMDIANGMLEDAYGAQLCALARTQSAVPYPSGWKANYMGVDLNLNYPALWETARANKAKKGVYAAGPRDWTGAYPLSEPESRALYMFTRMHDFRFVLAYHTQGEVIYWRYGDKNPPGAVKLAARLSAESGYALEETPFESAFAGYKDWFIQTFNRPGFTVEAGNGQNPLPLEQLDEMVQKNEPLLMAALMEAAGL